MGESGRRGGETFGAGAFFFLSSAEEEETRHKSENGIVGKGGGGDRWPQAAPRFSKLGPRPHNALLLSR